LAAALADVLEGPLGDPEGAFARRREALEASPGDRAHQEAFVASARATGRTDELVSTLEALAEAQRESGHARARGQLLVRLGEVKESQGDEAGAADLYERAEGLVERPVAAWQALARIGAARGDRALQRRVLTSLVDAPELGEADRAAALYQLAEVEIAEPETAPAGVGFARRAFDLDPRHAHVVDILDGAAERGAGPELLALYEEVARDAGDDELLLRFLVRRAESPSATLAHVREAADKARQRDDATRAEGLYARAVQVAEGSEEGLGGALWALQALAERRLVEDDVSGALGWLRMLASATEDALERRDLLRRIADLATGEHGDPAIAAEAYAGLLADGDLTDRSIWEPLLGLHRQLENEEPLADLVAQLVDGLLEPDLRNLARLEHAKFLLDREGREPDAIDVLKAALDEEPEHAEATRMLGEVYERSGYEEDLAELLERRLDLARDREDTEQVSALTLRLGALLGELRPADALDVYRRGLDWLPTDRAIASAALACLGDDGDAHERAELRARLLATESGEAASALARELASEWDALGEAGRVGEALALGFVGNPDDAELRARLEDWHRAHGDAEGLAGFLADDGLRLADAGDDEGALAKLREAVALRRDTLGDAEGAIAVLREARGRSQSVAILRELVTTLEAAGDAAGAADAVGAALAELPAGGDEATRTALLGLKARLGLSAGRTEEAVRDLEAAYAVAPELVADDLIHALRQHLAEAREDEVGRPALLRLAQVLGSRGDRGESRELLAQWTATRPDDVEVLLKLRALDVLSENWVGVAETCARLAMVLEGEAQAEAALLLADACDAAGTPEQARAGLEHVNRIQPADKSVAARLRSLYESLGADRELADLLMRNAGHATPEEAFELYQQAGQLFVDVVRDPEAALPALRGAHEMRPDDHDTTLLLADGYIGSGYFAEAGQLLEKAISDHPRRRSPELSELQHRMARLARAAQDRHLEMQWLNAALESDKNNGLVSSELAVLAYELGELDVALIALRAVTLSKEDGPMSRAAAFLMQARIAHQRGEARRALLWARKAKSEDPELHDVDAFLRDIGE
ncbi:MAG: hypothetical protein AAGH15_14795, partial [Myxococcota bacterium]